MTDMTDSQPILSKPYLQAARFCSRCDTSFHGRLVLLPLGSARIGRIRTRQNAIYRPRSMAQTQVDARTPWVTVRPNDEKVQYWQALACS